VIDSVRSSVIPTGPSVYTGTLVAVFTAELPDAFDTLTTTPRNIIYACGTIAAGDKLDSHLVANQAVHPYGQAQLQFRAASANGSSDSSSGVQATSSQEDTSYMWAHAWLMGLGWGLFIPLGAVIAHGFKEYDPAWFQIHRALQSLGLIMGFIGLGLIFKFADDKYAGNPEYSTWNIQYPKHRNIGISVMALGLAQATALVFRPHKGTKLRTIWHVWHALVGLAAISLAIANVYIGMYQVKVANTANWARVLYSVALGLIAALGLGREGFRLLRRKKAKEGVDGGKEEKGVYAEAVVGTPKA
jgi:Eukaryotic cytochrome b561